MEDLRDIYRVFDRQMSAMLRVSRATSADDVVDALLTAVLRFASALIMLRDPAPMPTANLLVGAEDLGALNDKASSRAA
jgi:hypothetical protein